VLGKASDTFFVYNYISPLNSESFKSLLRIFLEKYMKNTEGRQGLSPLFKCREFDGTPRKSQIAKKLD